MFGYLAAAARLRWWRPLFHAVPDRAVQVPPAQTGFVFAALFLVIGFILGTPAAACVSEIVGVDISMPDRMAGAMLGAVRTCCWRW